MTSITYLTSWLFILLMEEETTEAMFHVDQLLQLGLSERHQRGYLTLPYPNLPWLNLAHLALKLNDGAGAM